jgi:hypothetical protein
MSAEHDIPKGEDGYVVHNEQDWPPQICGSLTLRDVFIVAQALPELGIPADATFDSRGEVVMPAEQGGPSV